MKSWLSMGIMLWLMTCCTGCEESEGQKAQLPDMPEEPIVIVYENDVHCAVEGYAQLVAVRESVKEETPYVSTVSCGDFVQGDLVGSVSQGEYIVDIMNHVGYDVVTLGNHEFDFGMKQLFHLTESLNAHVVCANLRDLRMEQLVYAPYHIIRYGQTDVAFIGLTTTSTTTTTSPLTYQDEMGNLIYDFMKEDFYAHVQQQIDAARSEGADYVIALSHLGDIPNNEHATSLSLIAQTTGIDAILDGHSHSIISDTLIYNKAGKPVHLSSTGTAFQHIGLLTIDTNGQISTQLTHGEESDKEAEAFVEKIKEKANESGKRTIGKNTVELVAFDKDGNRLVRLQEMPIGNLCADAFRHMLNTDVALVNGGGIRTNLPTGEITYNHLLSVFPFGNTTCTATLTGQQLADALEVSVRFLPEESGSFMQVSGLKFEVDATIPSPVIIGEDELFSHIKPDAPRRVNHIYTKSKEDDTYHPLDPQKTYTLGGFDFHIKEMGDEGILRYTTLKEDNLGLDIDLLGSYIEQHLGGTIGAPYNTVEGRIVISYE